MPGFFYVKPPKNPFKPAGAWVWLSPITHEKGSKMATENIDPKNTIIGVVGAGNMGSGIAQKYATEGFQVVVVDINEDAVTMGQQRVSDTLNEGVARKVFTEAKRDAILDNMTFTTDKGALKNAALVVEAIFENKEVKQTLFQELDGICGEDTILATNTSSFYVDDNKNHPTRKRHWPTLLLSPRQKPFGGSDQRQSLQRSSL